MNTLSENMTTMPVELMKAVRFHRFGGPELLLYEDAPKPTAGADEVIVRVEACVLNHLDLWITGGIPAYPLKLPHIPGSDVSGLVSSFGPKVSGLTVGERVFIAPGLSCFRCGMCISGADHLWENYQIIGAGPDGGYAEFIKVPKLNVLPMPPDLSFEEAAVFPLTFLTAWHMLITRAVLRPGQDLLVLAGGSGVGSAAIQIGKLMGARVIATASGPEKLQAARKMGADILIDYEKEDFSKAIKEITNGRGVQVVFEHIGPDTFQKSLRSLALQGCLITCGATTGPKSELDLRYLFSRELTIMGAKMGTRSELLQVARLVGQKKLSPVIDSVFSFSEAKAAQEKMQSRVIFGKIILKP
jgi:NADPH:quinone reductase-like Zn-dependent oxidoreductase